MEKNKIKTFPELTEEPGRFNDSDYENMNDEDLERLYNSHIDGYNYHEVALFGINQEVERRKKEK